MSNVRDVTRKCDNCGVDYFARSVDLAKGKGLCCSVSCGVIRSYAGVRAPYPVESRDEVVERFKSKILILPNGCWSWTDWLDDDGYGRFKLDKRQEYAHRASYLLFVGPLLKGEVVRHKRDFAACVNPEHLVKGSQIDNVQDMVERRRFWSKLTDVQVIQIRSDSRRDFEVADDYGIHARTVRKIRNGNAWKFLEPVGVNVESE